MKLLIASLLSTVALTPALAAQPLIAYLPNSLVQSRIDNGPWTLHESNGQGAHDASGIIPTTSGPPYVGSGTPYAGYCVGGAPAVNHGLSVMQPYYFPFVRRVGERLEGLFDYRPRNEQEATVAAFSEDWGATWRFAGEALRLNPYCPWDPTDPDNLTVAVGSVQTAYGASSANAGDNGLGHPVALRIGRNTLIYTLDRANGHIDSDQLVVHKARGEPRQPLQGVAPYGFVSPLASGGYPALDPTALATTGLQNPDALMGEANVGGVATVVYVEKTLNADTSFPTSEQCPPTPPFALTNLVNHKARKPNHDVTVVRVATTTDGLNFTDVGAATGLNDPTAVALNAIRYLGSGSLLKLADGRYAMFFGAGNCLDNDSDGFHFMGYAETTAPVRKPSDLLSWTIVNGLDNPILSTDTVTDLTNPANPRPYPASAPLVNVAGADALTGAQVAPWTPVPGGYNSTFFSGRVYDPQAIATDERTVTIVFAGYNTPQPSSNLGDYRSIGRFQVRFPEGYVAAEERDDR